MRYKVFGIALIAFIILMLFLWLRPKSGISPVLLMSPSVDSIRVYKGTNDFTVTSPASIDSIVRELQAASQLKHPESMNINNDYYDLDFYIKGHSDPETIRVLFNKYNGIVIDANDYYYEGKELNNIISGIKPS